MHTGYDAGVDVDPCTGGPCDAVIDDDDCRQAEEGSASVFRRGQERAGGQLREEQVPIA